MHTYLRSEHFVLRIDKNQTQTQVTLTFDRCFCWRPTFIKVYN